EQVRPGGRRGAVGPGGAGGAGAVVEVRVSGGRRAGDPGVGLEGDRGGQGVGGQGRGIAGGAGQEHSGAEAGGGEAVPDAGGGRVFDHGAGDGGDGPDRAGEGEGGGGSGDGGVRDGQEDGGDGGGDVPQAAGRGAGGGQRGAVAARRGEARGGAGDGAGEAEVDHAAHAVRERSVRLDQRGRRAAYPLLQGVSAAVLSADDGCDGDGGAAGGGGDGDAGGQHEDDDRADHADRDGGAAAVCDPRRRPYGGRRRGHENPEIRRGATMAGRIRIRLKAFDHALIDQGVVERFETNPDSASHSCSASYFRIFVTTPAPTVRPPSRIANRSCSSIAIGVISSIVIFVLSPGITISTPAGS